MNYWDGREKLIRCVLLLSISNFSLIHFLSFVYIVLEITCATLVFYPCFSRAERLQEFETRTLAPVEEVHLTAKKHAIRRLSNLLIRVSTLILFNHTCKFPVLVCASISFNLHVYAPKNTCAGFRYVLSTLLRYRAADVCTDNKAHHALCQAASTTLSL